MASNMGTCEALNNPTTSSPPSTANAVEEKAKGESSVNPAATAVGPTTDSLPTEASEEDTELFFTKYHEEIKMLIELKDAYALWAKRLSAASTSDAYKEDPEFEKDIFEGIVSNRIDQEREQKEKTLREFELQKIRLQNETRRVVGSQTLPQAKIELQKLLPTFNPEVDNMELFLNLFERQMKLQERSVLTRFIILPKAKGNRTLLRTDLPVYSGCEECLLVLLGQSYPQVSVWRRIGHPVHS
ncbi:uncharacterized protein NPIL_594121 [Nephila pilipes]|uniref:Uncharacterized protein n=1 Tax=Nephila pilipes TaxID=299642 RepID=A0A8X6TX03_NEPPI|nr:uncharacterized protein NPIL_594121 [Nephila pilipes]